MKILRNEKGIALVMVLVLSAIALAIMSALLYMVASGTKTSGLQKRYKTALDAGIGGSEITYQLIALRGESAGQNAFVASLTAAGLNPSVTTSPTCTTNAAATYGGQSCVTLFGSPTGLAAKLTLPTDCWSSACNSSLTINPAVNTTYDIQLDLGTATTYTVYAKVANTIAGNTGGDEGLWKSGVVSANTGEVTAQTMPYLYTIEVDAENPNNQDERAKLSILYQY